MKIKSMLRIFLCLNLLFLSPYALSAEETAQPLFSNSEQDIPEVVLLTRAERSIVRDSRFVSIDTDILGGAQNTYSAPAQRILLNLLNNEVLVARLNRIENVSVGGYNWIGEIEGIKLSQAIFSVKNGVVAGKIIIPGKIYEIRYITSDLYAIQEINQSAFPPEAEPIAPPFLSNESTDSGAVEVAADSCTDITVLVPYSTEAKNAAGGTSQIESVINLAVAETNQSYVNSGLTQRLTLVHTMETSEAANDFSTDLSALQNTSDGIFDDVDVARNTYYADLVGIIIENSSSCGLGYVNSSASYAFSVTHRTCATGYFSFGHELGHNMGARHDWYVDDSTSNPVAYSKGFVNVTDGWRTIMAYNDLCSDQATSCLRLQYWSNPNVNYSNDPMGIISTGPTNCLEDNTNPDPSSCAADNRIMLNSTCSTVANFRNGTVPPSPSGDDFLLMVMPPILAATKLSSPQWGAYTELCCSTSSLTYQVTQGSQFRSSTLSSCSASPTFNGYLTTTPGSKFFSHKTTSSTCGVLTASGSQILQSGKRYLWVAEFNSGNPRFVLYSQSTRSSSSDLSATKLSNGGSLGNMVVEATGPLLLEQDGDGLSTFGRLGNPRISP